MVTVCLHLDEYGQAGEYLASALATVPGSFLSAIRPGRDTAARESNVVLLPILTDTTRRVCLSGQPLSYYRVG